MKKYTIYLNYRPTCWWWTSKSNSNKLVWGNKRWDMARCNAMWDI